MNGCVLCVITFTTLACALLPAADCLVKPHFMHARIMQSTAFFGSRREPQPGQNSINVKPSLPILPKPNKTLRYKFYLFEP